MTAMLLVFQRDKEWKSGSMHFAKRMMELWRWVRLKDLCEANPADENSSFIFINELFHFIILSCSKQFNTNLENWLDLDS